MKSLCRFKDLLLHFPAPAPPLASQHGCSHIFAKLIITKIVLWAEVGHPKIHSWSPKAQHLRKWLYLEIRYLMRWLSSNEATRLPLMQCDECPCKRKFEDADTWGVCPQRDTHVKRQQATEGGLRGDPPCRHLGLRLTASRTVRK